MKFGTCLCFVLQGGLDFRVQHPVGLVHHDGLPRNLRCRSCATSLCRLAGKVGGRDAFAACVPCCVWAALPNLTYGTSLRSRITKRQHRLSCLSMIVFVEVALDS